MISQRIFRCAVMASVAVTVAVGSTARADALPRDGAGVTAPAYNADAPDPDVILVSSTFYAYTTGTDLKNIPVLASTDLQSWHLVGDALPALPPWSEFGQTWAPGVVNLGGDYVMYYSTEVAATGQDCISVATATSPTGPFVDNSSTPFICQADLGGSIDPQPFVDTNGTLYLYWKSNANPPSSASIWVAELSPDGTALMSGPEPVLGADQSWESTVESPDMVEEAGSYVLFYSGGTWDSAGYGVGYADCAGPFGPCSKPQGTPLLHSDGVRLGPGGESLVEDASGNWWMAYAAWDGPTSDYSYGDGDFRSLWVAPVTFSGGTPAVDAGEAAEGYRLVAADGGVFPFGGASFLGSMGGHHLDAPVVGAAADTATGGYWEVASDGGVFSFGAPFFGSMGGHRLDAPVVGMTPTPDGGGYWLVAADGGIFSFGDAAFYGSTGGIHLAAPMVGMAAVPGGGGYWLVAADGGVFAFGDAAFYGSAGGFPLAAPVTGIAALPQGGGYWLVSANGGLFPYGAATLFGSVRGVALAKPVKALVPGPGGAGYWEVAADGGIFAFGDAAYLGSAGGIPLAAPVVAAMAA